MSLNAKVLDHFATSWLAGTPTLALLPGDWRDDASVIRQREVASEVHRAAFPEQTWALKVPRLCLLLPFRRAVVEQQAAALLVIRHPIEIARSLEARNAIPVNDGLAMWNYYLHAAVENLSGVTVLVTEYEVALDGPRQWCDSTAEWRDEVGVA
jgi:hypothetical protein